MLEVAARIKSLALWFWSRSLYLGKERAINA